MKRLLALAGLLITPLAASAANVDLYDVFRQQVRKELVGEVYDPTVIQFLQGVYRQRWDFTTDEMKRALESDVQGACGVDANGTTRKPQSNSAECGEAIGNVQILGEEEQEIRGFGRQIQRIAAAQELPLSEIPGRPFHLATDLSGIVNIWRAGTGSVQKSVTGAVLVRTRPLTEDEVDALDQVWDQMEERGVADMGLPDAVSGIVWRYQYGVRLVKGERNPDYPPPHEDDQSDPGTERQYQFRNWQDGENGELGWEEILTRVWELLPTDRDDYDPPLSGNEVAYILFPDEVQGHMPPGTILWARVGGEVYEPGVGERDPLGDVGLAWEYPIEPLLPSLLSIEPGKIGTPILGGRYPPEPTTDASTDDQGNPVPSGEKAPADGRGLCSMALAKRGYLCRPLTLTDEQRCPEDNQEFNPDDEENVITLVSCTLEEKPTLTVAGADVCREIEWKNGEQEERCSVDFYEGDCGGADARADFKTPDGRLGICVGDLGDVNLTYALEHELVHAQQFCGMPAGNVYENIEGEGEEKEKAQDALCCRLEGEAYLANCKRMYDDGLLRDDGAPAYIKGVEVTPQTCMEISRLKSCQWALGRDVKCPSTTDFTADDIEALEPLARGNPEDLPDNFEEATDPETMDARIAARVRTIERQVPVCAPGTETTYKNTIGNNACYVGQCVEESLELHRLTGGRSPATVGDEAFPFDDPDMGSALATTLRSVPVTNPPLPSYRPEAVMRTLEDALCQLQGLPASTPPHLCAFSSSRRLELPLASGVETTQSIIFGAEEQRDETMLVRQIASALGSRIGTDMQGQYLRIGTRTLSEVVALANSLLRDMLSVHFPANMCPLSLPR